MNYRILRLDDECANLYLNQRSNPCKEVYISPYNNAYPTVVGYLQIYNNNKITYHYDILCWHDTNKYYIDIDIMFNGYNKPVIEYLILNNICTIDNNLSPPPHFLPYKLNQHLLLELL
jgi:hypothetical protein